MAQNVAIVGASIGGLAAAHTFTQLGYRVQVFERAKHSFEAKGHGLGFVDVSLWEHLTGRQMLRRGEQASRDQGAFYYGDLWKFLFDGLPPNTVRFDAMVESLGNDAAKPTINGTLFDLVVVADGGWSGLRHYVTTAQPEYAGYVGWRGKVSREQAAWFGAFGIFKSGIYDTIAMPQACDDGTDNIVAGFAVATPEHEVTKPMIGAGRHGTDRDHSPNQPTQPVHPSWLLPLHRKYFGNVAGGQLTRLFETMAAKGDIKSHPQYEFGADKVTKGRIVLVGDAAHMASPRTAVGAHTAVLDAVALREAFSSVPKGDIDAALAVYGPDGIRRAQELYARSRQVSRDFVPEGGPAAAQSPAVVAARC